MRTRTQPAARAFPVARRGGSGEASASALRSTRRRRELRPLDEVLVLLLGEDLPQHRHRGLPGLRAERRQLQRGEVAHGAARVGEGVARDRGVLRLPGLRELHREGDPARLRLLDEGAVGGPGGEVLGVLGERALALPEALAAAGDPVERGLGVGAAAGGVRSPATPPAPPRTAGRRRAPSPRAASPRPPGPAPRRAGEAPRAAAPPVVPSSLELPRHQPDPHEQLPPLDLAGAAAPRPGASRRRAGPPPPAAPAPRRRGRPARSPPPRPRPAPRASGARAARGCARGPARRRGAPPRGRSRRRWRPPRPAPRPPRSGSGRRAPGRGSSRSARARPR